MPLVFVLVMFLLCAAFNAADSGEYGSAGVCVVVALAILGMKAFADNSQE